MKFARSRSSRSPSFFRQPRTSADADSMLSSSFFAGMLAMPSANVVPLVSFASDAPKALTHQWTAKNDPVMGGQSTSTVSVTGNILNFTGYCAIVPSLKAPGFITAETGGGFFSHEDFVDVSSCTGLTITAKAASAYKGYRISFGSAKPPGGKFFAQGFKADVWQPVSIRRSLCRPIHAAHLARSPRDTGSRPCSAVPPNHRLVWRGICALYQLHRLLGRCDRQGHSHLRREERLLP